MLCHIQTLINLKCLPRNSSAFVPVCPRTLWTFYSSLRQWRWRDQEFCLPQLVVPLRLHLRLLGHQGFRRPTNCAQVMPQNFTQVTQTCPFHSKLYSQQLLDLNLSNYVPALSTSLIFERLIFCASFSQFSARCRKEWVSIKSSDGGDPLVLCGSKLPQPVEFPGGNITVTHHFLPHLFPVSSFLLNYARGIVIFVHLFRVFF